MARTAEVKRDARIGEADAKRDAQIKEAVCCINTYTRSHNQIKSVSKPTKIVISDLYYKVM